uniref:Uncharacterized protein n=1 Tax=Anguilla anguilla TaxID=7936 RepID=A0A0E9S6K5_ANGAN
MGFYPTTLHWTVYESVFTKIGPMAKIYF